MLILPDFLTPNIYSLSREHIFHTITNLKEISLAKRNFAFPEFSDVDEKSGKYDFDVNVDVFIDEQEESVTKIITVKIVADDQMNLVIAEYQVLFLFLLKGLEEYVESNPGKDKTLSPDLNEWLNNVVLATTRGVMYADLRGTFLDKALLPLISPEWLKNF